MQSIRLLVGIPGHFFASPIKNAAADGGGCGPRPGPRPGQPLLPRRSRPGAPSQAPLPLRPDPTPPPRVPPPLPASSLKIILHLASLPASASPIAAAHITVVAFLAVSLPSFDRAARALFARPDGTARSAVGDRAFRALASDDVIATMDQFEAAVGNSSSQTILRGLWGNRAKAEERVRDLLDAEWAAIGPSKIEVAAERIVGDGAVETWRAADEATRAKFRILAEEEKTREILGKLEQPASSANPILTPAVDKVIDALNASCADLHSVVEDPLPAGKAVADEVLAVRMDKGVSLNAQQIRGQSTTCGAAGPSTLNEKGKGPSRGKPHNIMDRNPTAKSFQWEESRGVEGSESSLRRPHLSSPRRIPPSPLPPPGNKSKCRRPSKKWSLLEEETMRKGVQQYGSGNWKDILDNNLDVFIGRTMVDLKDNWRNMRVSP